MQNRGNSRNSLSAHRETHEILTLGVPLDEGCAGEHYAGSHGSKMEFRDDQRCVGSRGGTKVLPGIQAGSGSLCDAALDFGAEPAREQDNAPRGTCAL